MRETIAIAVGSGIPIRTTPCTWPTRLMSTVISSVVSADFCRVNAPRVTDAWTSTRSTSAAASTKGLRNFTFIKRSSQKTLRFPHTHKGLRFGDNTADPLDQVDPLVLVPPEELEGSRVENVLEAVFSDPNPQHHHDRVGDMD